MSEQRVSYVTSDTLLKKEPAHAKLETKQTGVDLRELERMLLPLLNQVRKAQGKKPVIVPKG